MVLYPYSIPFGTSQTDSVFFHKPLQMLKSYYDPPSISPKSFLLQSKHPQFLLSIIWLPASSFKSLLNQSSLLIRPVNSPLFKHAIKYYIQFLIWSRRLKPKPPCLQGSVLLIQLTVCYKRKSTGLGIRRSQLDH